MSFGFSQSRNHSDVIFKVQIGKGKGKTIKDFPGVDKMSYYLLPDGTRIYFSGGDFESHIEAVEEFERLKKLGYEAAVMTAFKKGAPISMDAAEVKAVVKIQKQAAAKQNSGLPPGITLEEFLAFTDDALDSLVQVRGYEARQDSIKRSKITKKKEAREQFVSDSLTAAKAEAERIEAERVEAERLAREQFVADSLAAVKAEAERAEAERIEAERVE